MVDGVIGSGQRHVPLPVSSKVQVAPLPSLTWLRPIIRPDMKSAGHLPPSAMSCFIARHWCPFGMRKTLQPGRPGGWPDSQEPAAFAVDVVANNATRKENHARRGFWVALLRMAVSTKSGGNHYMRRTLHTSTFGPISGVHFTVQAYLQSRIPSLIVCRLVHKGGVQMWHIERSGANLHRGGRHRGRRMDRRQRAAAVLPHHDRALLA
jgi:hypothetical protein